MVESQSQHGASSRETVAIRLVELLTLCTFSFDENLRNQTLKKEKWGGNSNKKKNDKRDVYTSHYKETQKGMLKKLI